MTVIDRRSFIKGSAAGLAVVCTSGCRLFSDGREADPGVLRGLAIDHDKCIGCHTCEITCDETHHPVLIDGKSYPGVGDPRRSLIQVHSFVGPYFVAWSCLGCPDLPCVSACDYYADRLHHRKALHVDPGSGAVNLDREACAGCERCLEACERRGGGVLHWDPSRFVVGACDLCAGTPACVAACPTEAIKLVTVDRAAVLAARSVDVACQAGLERVYKGHQG